MTWRDRITGSELAALDEVPVSGQFEYSGGASTSVRQVTCAPGDLLLAGTDGRFQSPDLGTLRVQPSSVPDADAIRRLERLGWQLKHELAGASWASWTETSPLQTLDQSSLDEVPLEREVRRLVGSLEAVCRKPRMHLKLEEERQIVSRCKRPASRALAVLASHSEDWDARTLFGIRPKRILGLVREDEYELYENRIATKLVDNLDSSLMERVRELRRVVRSARAVDKWNERLASGRNHRRVQRMCQLWGEFWSDDSLLRLAEVALSRVVALRRRVLALKDTVLYKQIGGLRRQLSLRMTNVLTHDPLYRDVAELWMAWERASRVEETPDERWAREQRAARGFDRFGRLLVVRALDFLGYIDLSESPLTTSLEATLEGPAGDLELRSNDGGALFIRSPLLGEELHFTTVPCCLDAAPLPQDWLVREAPRSTVVLFLEGEEKRGSPAQRIALSGPGPRAEPVSYVPVAPWVLESVERVARAIRFWLWGRLFMRYPLFVPVPVGSWRPPGLPPHLSFADKRVVILAPAHDGASFPALDTRVLGLADQVRDLEARIARLQADRRSKGPRQKGATKTTDQKGNLSELKPKLDRLKAEHRRDGEVRGDVCVASAATERLLTCPVCGANASPFSFEHAGGRFRVCCKDCGASWGKRDCGTCGAQFPFLQASDLPSRLEPGDVDEVCGCDVIALPRGPDSFLCTSCGASSEGATDAAS